MISSSIQFRKRVITCLGFAVSSLILPAFSQAQSPVNPIHKGDWMYRSIHDSINENNAGDNIATLTGNNSVKTYAGLAKYVNDGTNNSDLSSWVAVKSGAGDNIARYPDFNPTLVNKFHSNTPRISVYGWHLLTGYSDATTLEPGPASAQAQAAVVANSINQSGADGVILMPGYLFYKECDVDLNYANNFLTALESRLNADKALGFSAIIKFTDTMQDPRHDINPVYPDRGVVSAHTVETVNSLFCNRARVNFLVPRFFWKRNNTNLQPQLNYLQNHWEPFGKDLIPLGQCHWNNGNGQTTLPDFWSKVHGEPHVVGYSMWDLDDSNGTDLTSWRNISPN